MVPIFPLPQIPLYCGKLTLVANYYLPQTMSICGKLVFVAIHNLPQKSKKFVVPTGEVFFFLKFNIIMAKYNLLLKDR